MKFVVFVLSVLALALVVGCGSSDEDTLTKAEFIKKADAICKRADDRESGEYMALLRANPSEFQEVNGKGKVRAIRVILVPSIEKQIDDIEALGIPEDGREQVEKFFKEVETALVKIKEEPLAVEESREDSPLYDSYKTAQAYGFKLCREMY